MKVTKARSWRGAARTGAAYFHLEKQRHLHFCLHTKWFHLGLQEWDWLQPTAFWHGSMQKAAGMEAHAFIDKDTRHTVQENQAEPQLKTNCKPSCWCGDGRNLPPYWLNGAVNWVMSSLPRGFPRLLHSQAPVMNSHFHCLFP